MVMDPRVYDPAQDINHQTFKEVQQAKAEGFQLKGSDDLAIDLAAARVAEAMAAGRRAFIAPVHKNTKFLIEPGKPTITAAGSDMPAVAGMNYPQGTEIRRLGDVFIQFVGGICILDPDDPHYSRQLQWCEEHPEIARDAKDPTTDTWAVMKEGQTPLKDREPGFDPSVDVDAVMRGDMSSFARAGSIAAQARAILAGEASGSR